MLANTKVSSAKDHDENYIKIRPLLVSHLQCDRLLRKLIMTDQTHSYFVANIAKVIRSPFQKRYLHCIYLK